MEMLNPRHIQNFSEATTLEPHWGYADRALPCIVDAGSCSYLDLIYHSHDLSMLYVGIFWSSILGLLLLWVLIRSYTLPSGSTTSSHYLPLDGSSTEKSSNHRGKSSLQRVISSTQAIFRRYLLPDASHAIFGQVSRLQVLILAILSAYLIIFTFAGLTYQRWITPVKAHPGYYNNRSTLGPISNRIGVLAFALMPLSILLANRESILSLATGIPYHHFNFLHRWLGYIILMQSIIHSIGWTIVETRLYQPQPSTAQEWIKETYMIWGCVAIILLLLLWIFSLPVVIKRTGYEFFRKVHYILAMIFIGACWGHWVQLKCFLLPSLLLWFADRGARLVRTFLLHYRIVEDGSLQFKSADAAITSFPDAINGDIVRLDFEHPMQSWTIGQHFYLCFPQSSIWQSHPFTPLSHPRQRNVGYTKHSYIFRAKSGETKKVAGLAIEQNLSFTKVIMTGPYGQSIFSEANSDDQNILCVAGGTGITYVLPILLDLARTGFSSSRQVSLVWAVRQSSDLEWIKEELNELKRCKGISIHLFSTRDALAAEKCQPLDVDGAKEDDADIIKESVSALDLEKDGTSSKDCGNACLCCSSSKVEQCKCDLYQTCYERPNLDIVVRDFLKSTSFGSSTVYASGPGSMLSDLKSVVANCNMSMSSRRYQESANVKLICDERLEW